MPDTTLIESIKALGAVITPLGLAWIAYLQIKAGKKTDAIHKEMNGMKDQLVKAEKKVSNQEGNLEGRAELKDEQKQQ